MAIIYTYPQTSNFKSNDCFIISDGSDNKTKKLSASGLLSWIDNNLEYDLQQVLNAGSIADETTGTWNTVEIFRNQGASEKFLQLAPSAGVSGEMKIFSKVIVDKGLDSAGVITSPQSEKLVIIGDGELTLSSSGTVDIAAADYDAQIITGNHTTTVDSGKLTVTTTENKQTYKSAGDGTTAFEFSAVSGVTTHPYLFLEEDINLWIKSKVTDVLGNVGTADKVLKSNAQGYVEWADYASPSADGPTKSIQYNKGNNEFGGEDAFTYDSASNTMEIGKATLEKGVIKIHTEESANPARLAFHDGANQSLAIESPLLANTDYVLTLPVDAPANPVSYLVSDASGVLSWGTAGGSAQGINGTVQLSDGSGNFVSSTYLNYNDTSNTLNVGVGNTGNSPACGIIIGSSTSKTGTLGILGPNGGKVQFQAASTGSASVDLTFPDAVPQANQILQSDATGQLSWINTPTGGSGAPAGAQGEIQYNDGSGNFAAAASFKRDPGTGAVTISSQSGQIAALSAAGDNNLLTQGWSPNLGIANFDNAQVSASFSTVVAIRSANTTQANTELITFFTPSSTQPSGSIVYDTNTSQLLIPTTSDERFKENKADYEKSDAKSKIKALNVKKYNFTADGAKKEVKGFFAQQVKSVIPEAVIGEETDTWKDGTIKPMAINMHVLIPYLTAALQDAQDTIEKMEETLNKLESDNEAMSKEVEELKGIANEADNKADKAIEEAGTAKTIASAAEDQAGDAAGKAQSAMDTAEKAGDAADAADVKAQSASETATTADAKANDAIAKADKAQDAAEAADTKATAAQEKATDVEGVANTAKATADDAAATATAASEKATSAEEKATAAETKATEAISTADTAKATADTAKAKADTNETEIAKKADKTEEEGGEE